MFQPLTTAEMSKFNVDYGYKIVSVENGKLKNAGIKPGFIILSVDRQPMRTTAELKEALTERSGGVLIEGVYPNGLRAYYGIGL